MPAYSISATTMTATASAASLLFFINATLCLSEQKSPSAGSNRKNSVEVPMNQHIYHIMAHRQAPVYCAS